MQLHDELADQGTSEELFDLKTLTERANTLKEQIKDLELSIDSLQERHTLLEGEHERHSGQLEAARKRVDDWEDNQVQEIATLTKKLQRFADIDVTVEREHRTGLDNCTN